jgi:hypothetical protein
MLTNQLEQELADQEKLCSSGGGKTLWQYPDTLSL